MLTVASAAAPAVSVVETFRFSLLILGFMLITKYVFPSVDKKSKPRLPPGPRGIPIVGNLLQLGNNPHHTMTELSKQYGSVYKLKFGSRMVVVLNGMDAIKQALIRQPLDFVTRPEMYSSRYITDGKSVVFGALPIDEHRRYRKLLVDALKSYALKRVRTSSGSEDGLQSRAIVEEIVSEEISDLSRRLVQIFRENGSHDEVHGVDDGGSEMRGVFTEIAWTTSNIISAFLFGERHKPGDSHVKFIIDNNNDFAKICASSSAVDMMPWIRYVVPGILKQFIQVTGKFNDFMKTRIKNHLNNFDAKYADGAIQTTNVMDGLIEISRKNQGNSLYDEKRTHNTVIDLMGAGFDTVSKGFMWLTVYASVFEDSQRKIQREIDDFMSREKRNPRYSDRSSFPYLEAFIYEVLRHSSYVPFTIPHAVSRDGVRLYGYDLPKDTIVFINQWSVNHDKVEWRSPEHFRPERFLDVDGRFLPEVAEKVLIFGAGKRVCPGKALAKLEMFLFMVEMLKECNLSMHPDHPGLPATEYGLTMRPETGKMIVESRY